MASITAILMMGLTAGAAGMAAGALQEMGREAYVELKTRVVERFKGKAEVEPVLTMLESEPESSARQALLQEELEKGIAADPEAEADDDLREAAQKLLDIVENDGLPTASTVKISLTGSGAVAHGKGAVAAGERGVAIGGNVDGSTIITGDNNNQPKAK